MKKQTYTIKGNLIDTVSSFQKWLTENPGALFLQLPIFTNSDNGEVTCIYTVCELIKTGV